MVALFTHLTLPIVSTSFSIFHIIGGTFTSSSHHGFGNMGVLQTSAMFISWKFITSFSHQATQG